MNRVIAVTRMHLTDRLTLFGMSAAILAAATAINLLMFSVEGEQGARTGTGALVVYAVVLAAAVMCTARGMMFALSLGASRRTFALGTLITGGLLAVIFGLVMFGLNRIELATGGWWMHGHFFRLPWLADHQPVEIWLVLTVPFMAVFLLGMWLSTIWLRWKTTGMIAVGVATVLAFGGAAVIVTWAEQWTPVGAWFQELTPLTSSGWIALACLPLAAAAYLTLRRITL